MQAAHAALSFSVEFPGLTRDWHESSQVLVLLSVPSETVLETLAQCFWAAEHKYLEFHEPDLDGALTAIAVEPAAGPMLRHLPLALRGGEHHGREQLLASGQGGRAEGSA